MSDLAQAFSERFRAVSNRYPRRVSEAYGRDAAHAMADSESRWLPGWPRGMRDNGLPVRDWRAIGRAEGRDGSEIR
ncbi:hypothetical protein BH24CHL7_BH24CHL7_01010 [soil metagenome]